jgi:AAA domain
MTPPPYESWVVAKIISQQPANGAELAAMSEPWRELAQKLAATPETDQPAILAGFLIGRTDSDAIIKALTDANANGPAPALGSIVRSAHLGDLTSCQSAGRFIWQNWIVRAHFTLLSSDPKIGKTHLALDLARRLWLGLPWPDGQAPTFPAGTTTLWVCGDRHQDELRERAAAFGLPPEAVRLNARPDNPYGGWDLDDPDNVKLLADLVASERPGLAFIDTVWRATRRRLNREDEVNAIMTPIVSIAQSCDVSIMGLMHLSQNLDTLGRRLEGLARGIMKLFKPDPGQPDRRKLIVIGNFKEPPALGVTIRDGGCDFDSTPPEEPAKNTGGRPPAERETVCRFIREALAAQNDLIGNNLFIECEKKTGVSRQTFWRAVEGMKGDGELTTDGGRGTGKQMMLHLNDQNPPAP